MEPYEFFLIRITCPGGRVMDERTGRRYRRVECRELDAWHFVVGV